MVYAHNTRVKPFLTFSLAAAFAVALPMTVPGLAHQPKGDQGAARKEAQAGHILKSREIEARILPMMGGAEYLGFAYDSTAMAYRLKFIRDRRVLFVDVDARSGRIIQRSW